MDSRQYRRDGNVVYLFDPRPEEESPYQEWSDGYRTLRLVRGDDTADVVEDASDLPDLVA